MAWPEFRRTKMKYRKKPVVVEAVQFTDTEESIFYQDISEHDTPRPNTAYGKSKLDAEKYLHQISTLHNLFLS